ncbi:MAG: potassium/proton antiporter [Cytophagaceae bacterium]
MLHLEAFFLTLSTLVIISILIAKASNNIGVPVLLLFLGVGMLAGSEGPGGIYFDDASLAQTIGIVALILILFSGGLDTKWNAVRPVLWPALSLATIGVVVTTAGIAFFVHWLFDLPLLISLLLGSIISSTDAAAVFSIIGTRNLRLKGNITPLLELESGSNDPMAVFLTISLIELITDTHDSYSMLALNFVLEMGIGLILGIGLGKATAYMINKLKFPVEGFYTVFALAAAVFIYALTTILHGSGFLAVYLAGMMLSYHNIVYKKNIFRFFDGLAWLSQVVMFLTLGLLVFPSQILPAFRAELVISLFLIFIARPIGVFISLIGSEFKVKEKLFISWVGLRGAVPIILATFPMIEGISQAQWIFNVVFFIVLTSALLQGWTIPFVARFLKLDSKKEDLIKSPSEFSHLDQIDREILFLTVSDIPALHKKALVEIRELKGCLIVTVKRNNLYFVPSGGTILETGDEIQVLAETERIPELKALFK